MEIFSSRIHHWYSIFKRDLPWRNSPNPYFVWLSEIILQQTRVDQGLPYFQKFIDAFPTIGHLANAPEDLILKYWQGLGYYSRARNLHFTAKQISQRFNGEFPGDYHLILSLKGIGPYTAAAIASISFKLEYPTVDGNVYRVLSRFFGITEPIDSIQGKKVFEELARELIRGTDPGMHNQALMEFGALQCTPKKPDCLNCPVNDSCYAFSTNTISELPVKQKKAKQRDRYFNYIVMSKDNCTWLRKRSENDIWKNLFEFPYLETSEETDIDQVVMLDGFRRFGFADPVCIEKVSNWKTHLLSHQRIHHRFILISLAEDINLPDDLIKVNQKDIFNFAVPKLLENYLVENRQNVLLV